MDDDKKEIIEIEQTGWKIPDCCRENWENCPHVTPKPKKQKRNVGL